LPEVFRDVCLKYSGIHPEVLRVIPLTHQGFLPEVFRDVYLKYSGIYPGVFMDIP